MLQTPGIGFPPDSSVSLWRKIANNFYDIAISLGYSGDLQPSAKDNDISSMRKAVVYTEFIANNI